MSTCSCVARPFDKRKPAWAPRTALYMLQKENRCKDQIYKKTKQTEVVKTEVERGFHPLERDYFFAQVFCT